MIRKRSGGNVDRSIVGFVFEKENATVSRAGAARNGTERNGTRASGWTSDDRRAVEEDGDDGGEERER